MAATPVTASTTMTADWYGSGPLAKVLGLSRTTVLRMIDRGDLLCVRPTGGQDRRVPHRALLEYLRRQGLEWQLRRIDWRPSWVVCDRKHDVHGSLFETGLLLPTLYSCDSLFAAGRVCWAKLPVGVVLHADLGRQEVLGALEQIRAKMPFLHTIILAGEGECGMADRCVTSCDRVFKPPYPWEEIGNLLRSLTI